MTVKKVVIIIRSESETKKSIVDVVAVPKNLITESEELTFAMQMLQIRIQELKRVTRDWYIYQWNYEIHSVREVMHESEFNMSCKERAI